MSLTKMVTEKTETTVNLTRSELIDLLEDKLKVSIPRNRVKLYLYNTDRGEPLDNEDLVTLTWEEEKVVSK